MNSATSLVPNIVAGTKTWMVITSAISRGLTPCIKQLCFSGLFVSWIFEVHRIALDAIGVPRMGFGCINQLYSLLFVSGSAQVWRHTQVWWHTSSTCTLLGTNLSIGKKGYIISGILPIIPTNHEPVHNHSHLHLHLLTFVSTLMGNPSRYVPKLVVCVADMNATKCERIATSLDTRIKLSANGGINPF